MRQTKRLANQPQSKVIQMNTANLERIYDSFYLFTISHNSTYGYWVTVEENYYYEPKHLDRKEAEQAVKLLKENFSPSSVVEMLNLSSKFSK